MWSIRFLRYWKTGVKTMMTFKDAMMWSLEQDWPELEVEGIDKEGVYVVHARIEMENRMEDTA